MCKVITLFILLSFIFVGCKTVETRTEVSYIKPEIPDSIISPCDPIQTSTIQTNGDLLMSYISLQSSYVICASKVTSIANILESYDSIYTNQTLLESK
jgi:hypothetical protein